MAVIKIKPTHPSQGEFVLLEEEDFDPKKHELHQPEVKTEVKVEKPKGAGK